MLKKELKDVVFGVVGMKYDLKHLKEVSKKDINGFIKSENLDYTKCSGLNDNMCFEAFEKLIYKI
jgi:hypothetical protein